MTNFEMNLALFKIASHTAIGAIDPERQRAVFGDATIDVAKVSLERLFQAGPILDHGKVHPMDKLLKSFGLGDNLVEWIKAGGSPLLATQHDSFPEYPYPPILGYLECLMEGPRGSGFLTGKQSEGLSLEQWRRGTDDEMLASSLLRGLSTGLIVTHHLGKRIPEVLFDVFKKPVVEAKAAELLRSMSLRAGETIYGSADHVLMTAYVFDRLGLTTLCQAVLESTAFTDNVRPNTLQVEHILWTSLCENKNQSMAHAQEFLLKSIGIQPGDSVIDHALHKPFDLCGNTTTREFIYERATRRMEFLIDTGALSQAKYWLKAALPHMDRFPVIPDDQKADFLVACKVGDNGSVMEDLAGKCREGLYFLITTMGRDGFLEAFRKTCERAVALSKTPIQGQTLYAGDLIGLNVQTLDEHAVLHGTLDCLMEVYRELWAGPAKSIQMGEQNFAVQRQFKKITQWVGDALTAAPSTERAVAWFKLFEQPFAQESFVAAIPPNQEVFRLMNLKQRAVQFGQDLGL